MKKNAFAGAASPASGTAKPSGWMAAWCRFWFEPRDPFGLHIVRLATGLLFLAWLLPFVGQVESFFGLDGWFDATAYVEASKMTEDQRPYASTSWSILYPIGHNPVALQATYWAAVVILVLYTLGVAPRLTSVLTFVIVVSFSANPTISYDADRLLPILAFYPMLGYLLLGQSSRDLSLTERLLGPQSTFLFSRKPSIQQSETDGSIAANVAVRLFQVHFAFLIVMMGLDKLQVGDWWSGAAFWYWLNPPGTSWENARAQAGNADSYLTILSLAVYGTLAWQIGFPLFAWRRGWRLVLLGGAVLGWIGLAVMGGLPLFGPIFVIVSLAYLTPEEWQQWFGFMNKLRPAAPAKAQASTSGKKDNKESASVSVS